MIQGRLRQCLLSAVSACFVFFYTIVANQAGQEPIPTQNRFPLSFLFLTPRPTSAQLPDPGSIHTAAALEYSSVFMEESNDHWELLADMEITVVELSITYGISSQLAIRLDAPVASMDHGFMDGFLAGYHAALGLNNYGREDRPDNDFAYHINKNSQPWVESEAGGWHLTDITVSVQSPLFSMAWPPKWKSAFLSSLKLPTGDAKLGYGSGNVDLGLFLPSHWRLDNWSFFLMPGVIYHGDPDTLGAHVSAQNSFSFFVGTSYEYNEKWCWLGQIGYMSTSIEKTSISKIDDGAYGLTIGVRRTFNRQYNIEFAFTEDIFTRAAPDFNMRVGLNYNYGKESR